MRSRGSFRTTYMIAIWVDVPPLWRKELDRIVGFLQEKVDVPIHHVINTVFSEEEEEDWFRLSVWFDVVVTLEREPGLFLSALMRDIHALIARQLGRCAYKMEVRCFPRAFGGGLLMLEDGSYYPHSGVLARLVEIQPAVL